jgi:hypothetical protein
VPLVFPLHPIVPPLLPVLGLDVLPPVDAAVPLVLVEVELLELDEVFPEDVLPLLDEDVLVELEEALVVDEEVLPDELLPEALAGCLVAASTRLVDTAAPASARSFATTVIWPDWVGSDIAAVASAGEPLWGATTLDVADWTVKPGSPSAWRMDSFGFRRTCLATSGAEISSEPSIRATSAARS